MNISDTGILDVFFDHTPLTILAAIEDPSVIIKILTHLGLPTRAPPKAPARLDAFLHTA